MIRFEPIAAMPARATYGVLAGTDSIEFAAPTDYADWGTGPINVGHVLADLATVRALFATRGRATYSRLGPRRRGPRRAAAAHLALTPVVPKLRWLSPADQMRSMGVAMAGI